MFGSVRAFVIVALTSTIFFIISSLSNTENVAPLVFKSKAGRFLSGLFLNVSQNVLTNPPTSFLS